MRLAFVQNRCYFENDVMHALHGVSVDGIKSVSFSNK